MRGIFPGKPRVTPQAICTTQWEKLRLVVYISGNALVILDRPDHILQTIYQDDVESLNVVAIDKHTGKIAVQGHGAVHIYKPYGADWGIPKWSLQFSIPSEHPHDCPPVLAWGLSEELLIANSYLKIYQTWESEALIWSTELSNPATLAAISPDGSLIATAAQHDRLVKIWRRRSYGDGNLQFDYRYLRHPSSVTFLQWREHYDEDGDPEHVLYTICGDSKARIWASSDPHGLEYLYLWSEIDLEKSIQPRNAVQNHPRYVMLFDGKDFKTAIDILAKSKSATPIVEHFSDLCKKEPEICMVVGTSGDLCVWGFDLTKKRPFDGTEMFNMIYVEELETLRGSKSEHQLYQLLSFMDTVSGTQSIVVRTEDSINWYEGKLFNILDPTRKVERFAHKALLTGHEGSIEKINRTTRGQAIISRTTNGENIIWQQLEGENGTALRKHSSIDIESKIKKSCVLSQGNYVATLHDNKIAVWDTRTSHAQMMASRSYELEGKVLCLLYLPVVDNLQGNEYVATISSAMKGIVWLIRLPASITNGNGHDHGPILEQFSTFELESKEDLEYVIPVDPAGSTPIVSGFLDAFAQDVALSYTKNGVLSTWAAQVNTDESEIKWFPTASIHTGVVNPSLASGSSIRKVALVDAERSGLSIWDTRSSQLEFGRTFTFGETIHDLDWTSTPDHQAILAIGFSHKVMILAQIRYDYLDLKPAWATIREIYTRESTPHPIGDSTWLGSGSLVIGAGNQLFVYDKNISAGDENVKDLTISTKSETPIDLFDVVTLLNGPLPIYHPQLLSQCILAGKIQLVQKAIIHLNEQLKFYTEGDPWDPSLSIALDEFSQVEVPLSKSRILRPSADGFGQEDPESVTEELAVSLNEILSKKSVPFLSSQEQLHLTDLIDCVATAEKHRRSMDENATRYLLFFRRYMLRKTQHKAQRIGVTWREIAWAFHSDSQEILIDLVSRHYQGKLRWEHAKESGLFMWMSDVTTLRIQFENVARSEYTKSDDRNPIDCSLYYLALRKKSVLQGLWKMATWHREQGATLRILSNNFEEPRWKTAALKNAYALMGKRRFEYAAAFFLLAGNIKDAVNICASQLNDVQLAIAVARVYDGDDSPVLHELLEEKVLPLAAFEGDRWMASWAFWMLGRRDMAVRSLITPVYTLLDSPGIPSQEAKSYLATDPALVVLYRQLREKTLQALLGASKVSPRAEWEFVIRIARLYDRMGCDVLALDLVRNWDFLKLPANPQHQRKPSVIQDPRKMLRRRSSLLVDDLPSPRSPTVQKTQYFKPPPAKIFEEPSANSLLDSFGF